ncbi:MAG: hypothetical protein MJK14_06970 [Rivularia sp. ALOHA_DT_140]|nr:hypothetical protein [Rivularia sp. ALOHA_DT_140]
MTNNRDISRWWSNLPVWRKQLIGLFTSELISIFGLVGVGAFLIIMGGRTVLVNQVKSELATTEINYNIKIKKQTRHKTFYLQTFCESKYVLVVN